MRPRWTLCLALLLASLSFPGAATAQGTTDRLVGTWKLRSFEVVTPNGQVVEQPMGPHPVGAIMYDGARMCVQITRLDRRNFAANDIRAGTPTEKQAAYETYFAYCGTYTIYEGEGFLVHALDFSLFPNWTGTSQKRFFELSGDRLTLTTPPYPSGGGQVTARLVWERAK